MSDIKAVKGFSGIVINQDVTPEPTHTLAVADDLWRYQEFALPDDYARGEGTETIIPDLSGFQLLAENTDAESAAFAWTVDYYFFGTGWTTVRSGVYTEAARAGTSWLCVHFEESLPVTAEQIGSDWRIGIQVAPTSSISGLWYSQPNPLASSFDSLRAANGTTAIQPNGVPVSICFRVLGLVADDGVDFLGNQYRSALALAEAKNTDPLNGAVTDRVWLSRPNPSRYAVESVFYDVRPVKPTQYNPVTNTALPSDVEDDMSVIDQVLVDPLTPGVWFHVYHSNEGEPGTTEEEWNDKLWTRVPKSFQALKRENHVLPEPIVAKYVKIEFTHLQARFYSPGDFPQPIAYKKHPKWVLDYFMARLDDALTPARRVAVAYDALQLAYDYYLDDLDAEPDAMPSDSSFVRSLVLNRSDASDRVDAETLQKINLSMRPFQERLSAWTKDTLEGALQSLSDALVGTSDYPIERSEDMIEPPDVFALRNTAVIFEQNYPVMFFYLTCRHKYREVIANFDHDRAYFAGVREVAFTRDTYTVAHDNTQYIEPGADTNNLERNDFVRNEDGILEVGASPPLLNQMTS